MKRIFLLTTAIISLLLCTSVSFADDIKPCQTQAAVREYIVANMPWPPGTARVDFLSGEPEVCPQGRHITLRVEPAGNTDYIGDIAFLIRSYKGGKPFRTETVRTRIEVLRDIVIAARTLPSGTVLKDGDIRTVQKWVRRIHPQSLTSPEEALGKRLSSQVRTGTEISAFMLKDAPLVRKGKIVKVLYDSGQMRILTVGISEEDGMAGAMIRVRNITSNKIIYARVMGDSLVGIEI